MADLEPCSNISDAITVDDTRKGIKNVKENIMVDKGRVDLYELAFTLILGAQIMFGVDKSSTRRNMTINGMLACRGGLQA